MSTPSQVPLETLLDANQMLDSLADGVYATDAERRIVFWNRAAERITGYRSDEVVGRSCSCNLLVHVDKDGHGLCGEEHCPLHRAIVTGQPSQTPLLVHAKCKDGQRIPTEVSVAPLRNAEGQVVGGIEVFREVTPVFDGLTRAAKIQQATMACDLPYDHSIRCTVKCTPADYVGGDFYRVERLRGESYVVLVADVMGHGLAAALHTMQLRALWEELRSLLGDPARLLSAMHERLTVLLQHDDYFATAVAAVLDLDARRLTYATAGHLPPFVRHRGESRFTQLSSTGGLPLGVCAQGDQIAESRELLPGDTLLLCTDVVVELEDPRGRPLTARGFIDLLDDVDFDGSRAALTRVETAMLAKSGGLRLPDDLTILCAQLDP